MDRTLPTLTTQPPPPGSALHVTYTKWGDRLHWHFDATVLGRDGFGTWLSIPPGTNLFKGQVLMRPEPSGFVLLIPDEAHHTANWNRDPPARLYCDMTSPATWTVAGVTMVDMDLDVIQLFDGTVLVDDEDEFAEHQLLFGYPPDVIAATESSCVRIKAAVEASEEPFATVGPSWLEAVPTATTTIQTPVESPPGL
jgi:hypothetical protein